ncbi:hypothetical protein L1887_36229 [Cichorium endivia]|nr:hypothetical protein L1887_36229 [Cichorium endivia]
MNGSSTGPALRLHQDAIHQPIGLPCLLNTPGSRSGTPPVSTPWSDPYIAPPASSASLTNSSDLDPNRPIRDRLLSLTAARLQPRTSLKVERIPGAVYVFKNADITYIGRKGRSRTGTGTGQRSSLDLEPVLIPDAQFP